MSMSPTQYRQQFRLSPAGQSTEERLRLMEEDDRYITPVSYSPSDSEATEVSFTNKHLAYLGAHPKVDPEAYLANLRIKTRVSKYRH